MTLFNYALNALGASVTGGPAQSGYPVSNVSDGSEFSEFRASTGSPVIYVDLGASQYITRFELIHNGAIGNLATGVLPAFSDDGITYTNLPLLTPTLGEWAIDFEGLTHRYWKFTKTAGAASFWWLSTLAIVGPIEAPPPPTNPASSYIALWLDGLEANYVPAVQDWLDAQ